MLNNLLFILGIIALSNGNISLDNNIKDNTIESDSTNIYGKSRGIKSNNKIKLKGRPRPKKNNSIVNEYEEELENDDIDNIEELLGDDISFNLNDINKGLKMLELSDEDLEDVSGGCLGVAVIASFVVCIGAPIVDSATDGRW